MKGLYIGVYNIQYTTCKINQLEIYGSSDAWFKVGFWALRINTITEYKCALERNFERYKGICIF